MRFDEDVRQEEIISEIKKLDKEKGASGIIVQLPLPESLDEKAILDTIDPIKDVDAINSMSVKNWTAASGSTPTIDDVKSRVIWPATARGVGELLDFYKIFLKGRKVCIMGRSKLVGAPIAALCRAKGALVTVCHSKTLDLKKETLVADVIISAVGKAGLITGEHVKEGQVVIDVGLSLIETGGKTRLVGDVDFVKVSTVLGEKGAITPVPGGVGPMTVLALFENLLDCAIM